MRKLLLLLTSFVTLAAAASAAEETPAAVDRSPVLCAWEQLWPAEQAALRKEFKTGRGWISTVSAGGDFGSRFSEACKIDYSKEQMEELGSALGAKAAEEQARDSLAKRKAIDVTMIDASLGKLDPDRRIVIGNGMTCDGSRIERIWDRSIRKGMTRAGIRSVDGVSVALVAAAMYYVLKQEGHMRKINGAQLEPCPPPLKETPLDDE